MPFTAYPYLWVSADIEVTPGSRKSKAGMSYPSFSAHGKMKPPRQASVWESDSALAGELR